MSNNGSSLRTQAKSAIRALDLLEAVGAAGSGLTFMELVKQCRMPKSSLFQLLTMLTGRGYLSMDPASRRYRLGIRAWELGQSYAQHRELVAEALPLMNQVVAFLNETVQLSVLDGLENVYLAKVDCSHALRLQSAVGGRLPAHATGLGKVLLAHLPAEALTRRLQGRTLRRITTNTVAEIPALLGVLASARTRGFTVDNEEYTAGLRCVAVPVYDRHGAAAAISTSIPSVRATPGQLAAGLRMLARASLDVSRRLGRTSDDPTLSHLALLPDSDLMRMIADALAENEQAAHAQRAGSAVNAAGNGG
jgi:DNA-binding IclR family transcriptional regulator